MKIKRTGSKEYGRYTKVLIVGEPGSGKTKTSSTWPNPIYASAEGGLMSIAESSIPYVDIKSSDDLHELKVALDHSPSVRESMFGFPVDTVVIDTIDEIQKILIRERLDEQRRDGMQLQDWGPLGEQMQAIIRGFRNMEMHCVFTCHVKESVDQETGKMFLKPALQGAIADQIPAYVDLALLLRANIVTKVVNNQAEKAIVRHLQTYPDSQHPWVKDRSGKLPHEIPVNFQDDYDRISTAIFGDLTDLPDSTESVLREVGTPPAPQEAVAPVIIPKPGTPRPTTPRPATPTPQPRPRPAPEPVPQPAASTNAATEKSVAAAKARGQQAVPPGVDPETGEIRETPAASNATANSKQCSDCGGAVESDDQEALSRIRFRRVLCRACSAAAKAEKAKASA